MISPRRARRLLETSETWILERLAALLNHLEREFEDATTRSTHMGALLNLCADLDASGREPIPGLTDLSLRCKALASVEDVLTLLVPVERRLGVKVRDEDILPRGDKSASDRREMAVILVADCLRSAFNVGGLLRTAEFFGAHELVVGGYSATPENPKVRRTALGSDSMMRWRQVPSSRGFVEELRAAGWWTLALETGPNTMPLETLVPRFPCALIVGNERHGLSGDLLAAVDATTSIGGLGSKASLNVVTATGIALHALQCAWLATDGEVRATSAPSPR